MYISSTGFCQRCNQADMESNWKLESCKVSLPVLTLKSATSECRTWNPSHLHAESNPHCHTTNRYSLQRNKLLQLAVINCLQPQSAACSGFACLLGGISIKSKTSCTIPCLLSSPVRADDIWYQNCEKWYGIIRDFQIMTRRTRS
jgi:hypothetical protein